MPAFDNRWFYEQLKRFDPEREVRLGDLVTVPRWRGMHSSVWVRSVAHHEWERLYHRVPPAFADEIAYLTNKSLAVAARVYPYFDAILANHAYLEWLEYAEFEYPTYRDHIVHPFKVAVLARWLVEESRTLNTIVRNTQDAAHVRRLLDRLSLNPSALNETIVLSALWLAGLYHDLGYGHNLFCYLEKRVRTSYPFYGADVLGGSVRGIPRNIIERSLLIEFLAPSHIRDVEPESWRDMRWPAAKAAWEISLFQNFPLNHSIAGALNLLCLLGEIIDHWHEVDPRLVIAFELAAEATFFHDLTQPDNYTSWPVQIMGKGRTKPIKVTFRERPLAVVLILADEIQEWGRPRLQFRPGEHPNEVITSFESKTSVDYEWDSKKRVLYLPQPTHDRIAGIVGPGGRVDSKGFIKIEPLSTDDGARASISQ